MQLVGLEEIQKTPSEDCLGINVWKPVGAVEDSALPGLGWVHGGGYVAGLSPKPVYNGAGFARQHMVVVSFNYRLGRFGFFAHPALVNASDEAVANVGYLDQIWALEWVRANISKFGGNPGRVTVMGESAGGASVIALMT